jgi:hypothetical protein
VTEESEGGLVDSGKGYTVKGGREREHERGKQTGDIRILQGEGEHEKMITRIYL